MTKNDPRMVPASLDLCLLNLNFPSNAFGTSIPIGPILFIYKKVNPKITMYTTIGCIYLYFYYLLKNNPFLVKYLFMWLALPLSAIYQSYQLVVMGGIASIILTFYSYFYLRTEIFPNVSTEDLVYFVMFGIFTTTFLLTFIFKIKEANNKLKQLAYKDPLTGAANRLLLKERFSLLKEKKVQSIALLFIDMNGFKRTNDTYGHEVGDQLLAKTVSRLNELLSNKDLLCRLGGDEFVILSSNVDMSNVENLIERIQDALEEPILLTEQTIKVSGSIGWSYTADVPDANLENMIKEADKAMYRVKRPRM